MKTQTILHYDNTLEGFLTCIFEVYANKFDVVEISANGVFNQSLDRQIVTIETDTQKAQRVQNGVIEKIGSVAFDDVYVAYTSCNCQKEMIIYKYLKLGFVYGAKVDQMLSHADVIAFNDILRKVRHECARMQGFVRFRQMTNGIFVAPMCSDNDVLELVFPYFVKRFGIQRFAIFDTKRSKAGFFDGQSFSFGQVDGIKNLQLSCDEKLFQRLWKNYYDTVTIASRKSERRRKQFMPTRYWQFMPEINPDD